jgi:hypothetical protein
MQTNEIPLSLPIKKRPVGRPASPCGSYPVPSGYIANRLVHRPKTKSGYRGAYCFGHDEGVNRQQCRNYADRIPPNLPYEYSCIKIRACKKHNDRRNNRHAHNHTTDCEICRGINSPFADVYTKKDGTEYLLCLYCADLYAASLGIVDEFLRSRFPTTLLGLAELCDFILTTNAEIKFY